jgi:diadenosine tetraphosphate (Ap4A) HIT family hydrolase
LKKCELCDAVKDGGALIENTLLYESENFIVTPSIGPIVTGQIMITSKEHNDSLSSMGYSKIIEAFDLAMFLSKVAEEDILFTEHGSFNSQSGGACIEHTHIHVIPGMSNYYNLFDGNLNVFNDVAQFDDLKKFDSIQIPYILNFTNNKIRVYEAYNCHSQMMRRGVCAKLGRADWDWKQNEQFPTIKKTIIKWEKLLRKI